MRTPTSKLTSKYQATIPEPVRRLLHLNAGDAIAFDIEDGAVSLRKARPLDLAFTEAIEETLGEWASDDDEDAYRDL
jgi:AbrB family looped-hinge helix DNA binding protein